MDVSSARRCWKRSKKARKLAQVARMTTEAVHEELKTAKEADALLRKRRPATVKDRREDVTTSPRTPSTTRTTSSWQAAGFSPLTPSLPTTPLQGVQEARTTFEENERARVCHDVLMLMTVEELKNALRLHGQLVSGLKRRSGDPNARLLDEGGYHCETAEVCAVFVEASIPLLPLQAMLAGH